MDRREVPFDYSWLDHKQSEAGRDSQLFHKLKPEAGSKYHSVIIER